MEGGFPKKVNNNKKKRPGGVLLLRDMLPQLSVYNYMGRSLRNMAQRILPEGKEATIGLAL